MNEDSPLNEENLGYSSIFTLRRLLLWAEEPMQHLQCICDVSQACKDKSGGAIISAVFPFSYHGDPTVQNIVTHLLSAVSFSQ